jgi:hypothetical protein
MLDLRRRQFLTLLGGAVAVWPVAARGQQRERVRRIAWLGAGRADEPSPYLDSLSAGLGELGWREGRNLAIGRLRSPVAADLKSLTPGLAPEGAKSLGRAAAAGATF